MKYYVVAKFRSQITLKDLEARDKKHLDAFRSFISYKGAREWLNKQFFDDCDYSIFTYEDKKWYRLISIRNRQLVK